MQCQFLSSSDGVCSSSPSSSSLEISGLKNKALNWFPERALERIIPGDSSVFGGLISREGHLRSQPILLPTYPKTFFSFAGKQEHLCLAKDRQQKFTALAQMLQYLLQPQHFPYKYMKGDLCEFCLFFTLLIIKNKTRHMSDRHRSRYQHQGSQVQISV